MQGNRVIASQWGQSTGAVIDSVFFNVRSHDSWCNRWLGPVSRLAEFSVGFQPSRRAVSKPSERVVRYLLSVFQQHTDTTRNHGCWKVSLYPASFLLISILLAPWRSHHPSHESTANIHRSGTSAFLRVRRVSRREQSTPSPARMSTLWRFVMSRRHCRLATVLTILDRLPPPSRPASMHLCPIPTRRSRFSIRIC